MLVVASTVCDMNNKVHPCDVSRVYRLQAIYSSRSFQHNGHILGDVVVLELEENLEFNSRLQPACIGNYYPAANTSVTLFCYKTIASKWVRVNKYCVAKV